MRTPQHSGLAACLVLIGAASLATIPTRVSADVTAGQSLWEALAELGQGDTRLMYSSEVVKPHMRVKTTPSASEPVDIVREILAPHGIGIIAGPAGQWLVVMAEAEPSDVIISLSGLVVDDNTGLPISGSLVRSGDQSSRTAVDGRFIIELELPGEVSIQANDYETRLVSVDSSRQSTLEVRLKPNKPDEIIVLAGRYRLFGKGSEAELNQEEINQLPHLSDDAMRVVHRLPAVASDDLSARFNIRGGARDETALRLDGLELIDPFHLKDLTGVFSIIDSNLIDSISVLPAGYPAQFGDSASGVVNVKSLPPPEEPVHSIGISFVNFFANSRGQFADKRGGWLASVRQGFLDLIVDDEASDEFSPRYLDAFVTLERDITDRHTASVHLLATREDLDITEITGNPFTPDIRVAGKSDSRFLWARLQSQWTDRLQSESVVWLNESDRTRDNQVDDLFDTSADVFDQREIEVIGIRSDWGWLLSNDWTLGFGLELEDHDVNYDYHLEARSNPILYPGHAPIDRQTRVRVKGATTGIHATLRKSFGPLSTELGWRVDQERYTGRDERLSSPRLAIQYRLGEDTRLMASWGDYNQFQRAGHLQVEDGVDHFFPATRTEHRVLGVDHRFNRNLSLRAAMYLKIYKNVIPRYTNLFDPLEVVPEANPDRFLVEASSAEASGIELIMKYRSGREFSWWASYALSSAEDRVEGANFPREWDQRHAVNVVFNWQGERWNFNVAGQWHSGWHRTEVLIGSVDTPDGPKPGIVPGIRNAENWNDYSRVDARLSRVVQTRRGQLTYYIEAYNLFGTRNQCCVDDINVAPGPELRLDVENWSGFLPSVGLVWAFP